MIRMENIPVKKIRSNAILPVYGSTGAAGADLHACLEQDISIASGETVFVATGLAMQIPVGYAGLIYSRSGMACKRGLAPANKVGVIDSDYRGEIIVALHNHGADTQVVSNGERIAQLLITPVNTPIYVEVDALNETARAEGGFGSTGK